MAIAVAVAAGIAAAVAYGVSTAGQHAATFTGCVDGRKIVELFRDRLWLAATLGDVLGALLQVVALSNGAVVIVQPLLILSLPIAVLARPRFGGPGPSRQQLRLCGLLVLALSGFFLLVGEPSRGRTIGLTATIWTTLCFVLAGVGAVALARNGRPIPRAAVFGAVAGCWFGFVSVLIEAVSHIFETRGIAGFAAVHGWLPLAAAVLFALGGYLLVQFGFQLGPIGASFPANLICDPVVAVVLGAVLLHERLPVDPILGLGYLICLLALIYGAIRLANPEDAGGPSVGRGTASATMDAI
ncbi:MAG: hypothetical protein JWN95_1984 [Frankiales bacterium]|nr:hypothetical protein [Frankiales bacterium]